MCYQQVLSMSDLKLPYTITDKLATFEKHLSSFSKQQCIIYLTIPLYHSWHYPYTVQYKTFSISSLPVPAEVTVLEPLTLGR
jgi:hypothetical protein